MNQMIKKVGMISLAMAMSFTTMYSNSGTFLFVKAQETDAKTNDNTIGSVQGEATKTKNVVDIKLETGTLRATFLKNNVFRLNFERDGNDFLVNAKPSVDENYNKVFILDKHDSDYEGVEPTIIDGDKEISLETDALKLTINKSTSLMKLTRSDGKVLWEEAKPITIIDGKTPQATQTLKTDADEYFYGGGTQNGYFSHKNTKLQIRTGGGWEDGGRSNPVPFYMSSKGYGVLRHTFTQGDYDFSETATFTHEETRFDAYYYVEEANDLKALINDFTEMTGRPVFWPRWAQYIGHADCYNYNANTGERDLNNQGTKVLNGYVVDHEIPLGWMLPQDGYGCHYGKTGTVDGNIENLKEFVDSANDLGVQVGLWTQSDLKNESSEILRNVDKEVLVAGTRGIKTDVAWVGPGYDMQLNSVSTGYNAIAQSGDRPFIFSLNGWAGSQRYNGIWTGDQAGGRWEYIRFMIPSYIGSGLSGQPNVGSDIDSIYKGNRVIATRDVEWKAFTPMLYNMGGWDGSKADELNGKTPWEYSETDGGESEAIQRLYLKTRSELTPYNYTLAKEANTNGTPLLRAMVLEYPNDPYTYGKETQYQYMWGPNLLVAPVYEGPTNSTDAGKRDNIYLPDENQTWIDFFTGEQYTGGRTLYNFDAPLWKLPVFIKSGAILPYTEDNNASGEITDAFDRIFDIYPDGNTSFDLYEDDGTSIDASAANTHITSSAPKMVKGEAEDGTATIKIEKRVADAGYDSQNKSTILKINTHKEPSNVELTFNGKKVELTKVTKAEYEKAVAEDDYSKNIYYYDTEVNLNKYAQGELINDGKIITAPKLIVRTQQVNVNDTEMVLTVDGFNNSNKAELEGDVAAVPTFNEVSEDDVAPTSITLHWDEVENADSYDLLVNGKNLITNVTSPCMIKDLPSLTTYTFQIRSVNKGGASEWSNPIEVTTKDDPFKLVPEDMSINWNGTTGNYSGTADTAIDRDLTSQWHSNGGAEGTQVVIDMKYIYDIESVIYVPRQDLSNGTPNLLDIEISKDGKTWVSVKSDYVPKFDKLDTINFMLGDNIKLDQDVYARYIRITNKKSVGSFFTAQEIMPIMKEGTVGSTTGASNVRLHKDDLSEQDLVPLRNYNGFEDPDTNFVQQVSRADMNYDGVIDGFDIAYVSSQLDGGIIPEEEDKIQGNVVLKSNAVEVKKGEKFTLTLEGIGLYDVNAISGKIPFDTSKFKFISVESAYATYHMLNYSTPRLHDDGTTDIYLAFANQGEKNRIYGDKLLATITVEALVDTTNDLALESANITNSNMTLKDAMITDAGDDVTKPEVSGVVDVNKSEIKVTTTTPEKYQPGQGVDKLNDNNLGDYTELVWNEGAEMPADAIFTFNEPQDINIMTVYQRASGTNGILKEFNASIVYEDDSTVDLGKITMENSNGSLEVKIPNDKKVKSVTVVFIDSYSGTKMLSVGEITFANSNPIDVKSIDFDKDSYSVNVGSKITATAIVLPENANNKNYTIEVENEEIATIKRVPNGNNDYYYVIEGLKEGKTKLIAKSAFDENITKEVEIEVTKGVINKSALTDLIDEINGMIKEIYTEESWNAVADELEIAKKVLNEAATISEIEAEAIKLEIVKNKLELIPTDLSKIMSEVVESADGLYSESNYATNLFDGNLDTYWETPYGGDQAYLPKDLIVKLDNEYILEQIDLVSHKAQNGGVTNYEVYTSLDGEEWTKANVGKVSPSVYKQGVNYTEEVKFKPIKASYIKVVINGAVGRISAEDNKYARIAEMTIYGTGIKEVSIDKQELKGGETAQATVTKFPTDLAVQWSSSDESVATVDKNGLVTGVSNGVATITASYGEELSASVEVTVDKLMTFTPTLTDVKEWYEANKDKDFTPDTWKAFEEAFNNANKITADNTQKEIDDAEKALKEAKANLVEFVELTDLKEAVEKAKTILNGEKGPEVDAIYSATSYEALSAAIKNAEEVILNPTDLTVAEANKKLMDANNNLVKIDELRSVINEMSTVTGDFTVASKEAFDSALSFAKTSLVDADVTKEEVEQAIADLESAKESLVTLSDLCETIAKADALLSADKDKLTVNYLEKLTKVYDEAKVILEKANASESEVKQINTELNTVINGAIYKADKSELNKAILAGEEELKNADKYTASSIEALKAAIEAAKEASKDENISQDKVASVTETLKQAIKNLVEIGQDPKPEDPGNNDGNGNSGDNTKPGDNNNGGTPNGNSSNGADTGDNTNVGLLAGTMLLGGAAAAAILIKKRREEEEAEAE